MDYRGQLLEKLERTAKDECLCEGHSETVRSFREIVEEMPIGWFETNANLIDDEREYATLIARLVTEE